MYFLLGELVSDVFYKLYNESFELFLKGKYLEEKFFKYNLRVLDNKFLVWIDVKEFKEKRNVDGFYYRESEIIVIKECLDFFMKDELDFIFGVIIFFSE